MLTRLYRSFKSAKLRVKLFISFLAVAVLPMAVLGGLSYSIARDSLRDQMENRVADYMDRAVTQLDAAYRRCQEAMDEIVYGDELLTLLYALENSRIRPGEVRVYEESIDQTLRLVEGAVKRVDFLLGGDAGLPYNNRNLSERVEGRLRENAADAALYEKTGALWFADEDNLYAVRRIPDLYSGREMARMVVTLQKRPFFTEVFTGNNRDFGILVADSGGGSVINLVKNVMTTGVMPINHLESSPGNLVEYNGARYLFARGELSARNWTLYTIVSYQYVVERTGAIIQVTVAAAAVGIALIALLSLLLSGNFARRIEFLIQQMKRVSTGDLLIEPAAGEEDEIGQLGRVFEQMVSKLERLIHDVYESRIAQRESELKALQAQINPHFLYNCLDNMNWYALMRGDEHSSYIITQLSDFYRTSLNRGRNTITVADELKNAVAYMNLQLELHDDRFTFEKAIDEGIEEYVTINLMLQPILENAVKHGVDKVRDKAVPRRITLSARKAGDTLCFTIYNTGEQVGEEVLRSVFVEKTKGYGLRNVDERLRLLFGEEYGVHIGPVPGGTQCTIVIPQRTPEQLEEAGDVPALPPREREGNR